MAAGSPDGLLPFGEWLQEWLPLAFEHVFGPAWRNELWPENYYDPRRPIRESAADVLFQSLIHDLTFIVVSRARAFRPGMQWQTHAWVNRAFPLVPLHLATLWSEPPWINPIRHVNTFVNNALAQSGSEKMRPPPEYLQQLCQRLAGGEVVDWRGGRPFGNGCRLHPERLEEELARQWMMRALLDGRKVRPPRRDDPAVSLEIVTAVSAFRAAGFFARWSK